MAFHVGMEFHDWEEEEIHRAKMNERDFCDMVIYFERWNLVT